MNLIHYMILEHMTTFVFLQERQLWYVGHQMRAHKYKYSFAKKVSMNQGTTVSCLKHVDIQNLLTEEMNGDRRSAISI